MKRLATAKMVRLRIFMGGCFDPIVYLGDCGGCGKPEFRRSKGLPGGRMRGSGSGTGPAAGGVTDVARPSNIGRVVPQCGVGRHADATQPRRTTRGDIAPGEFHDDLVEAGVRHETRRVPVRREGFVEVAGGHQALTPC